MAQVMTTLMNLAMRLEREQYLGASHYERSSGRRGYANGAKPKKVDTPAGTLTLDVPKTAGAPNRSSRKASNADAAPAAL